MFRHVPRLRLVRTYPRGPRGKSIFLATPCFPPELSVKDRYAGLSGAGGFRGGLRGAPRGLGGGRGLRGGGFRGGFRGGGFAAQAGAGRDFSNQDLYADYSGPDQQSAPGGLRMDGYGGGGGGYGGGGPVGYPGAGAGAGYVEPEPSQQIMVRNVCRACFFHVLPLLMSCWRLASLVYCQ